MAKKEKTPPAPRGEKNIKQIKLTYEFRHIIKEEIDSWDTVELLSTHAPSDEYGLETNCIFENLTKKRYNSVCQNNL